MRRDSRSGGLFPAAIRSVAAALGAVALVAGCGGDGPSAAEILSQSADRTSAVETFHLVVDIQNVPASPTGITVSFLDGDIVVPDRLRARIAGTFQGAPLSTELVMIGDRHFLKDPFAGTWRTLELGTSPVAFLDPTQGVLAVVEGASDVERAGSEDVGGVPSHRLRGKVAASAVTPLLGNPPSDKLLPVELWIGEDDLLLRRLRLSGPVAEGEPADAVRTVELSAFDRPVEIVAPAVTP